MRHHLILRVITKMLVGTIFLFALYVQFHGDYSPGGGFQAGVIMASGFIIYGVIFSLEKLQLVFPPWLVHKLLALGVLLYAGTEDMPISTIRLSARTIPSMVNIWVF